MFNDARKRLNKIVKIKKALISRASYAIILI